MIETKINMGALVLNVRSNKQLDGATIESIKSIDYPIYWNDSTCEHWSFDTKLNNGLWIENLVYNNELTQGNAFINN